MEHPCKYCYDADSGQPAGMFEPRCDDRCEKFNEYCDRAGKDIEKLITACEAIVRKYDSGK